MSILKNTVALLTVAGLATAASAGGQVIAFTSFENAFVGDRYVDTGDASSTSQRALVELLPRLQNDPDALVAAQVAQMTQELGLEPGT